jgi:LAGLIDADG endonuclease
LSERNNKYKYFKNNVVINNSDNNFYFNYFNEWLSGFLVAKGCFNIRNTTNNHSFSIEINDDKYILDKIKSQFNITNQIRKINNRLWYIEIFKKIILLKIINHCIEYPLLGEKIFLITKLRDLLK